MNLSNLVVVSSNPNKLKEINEILGTNFQVSKRDIPEIQSLDLSKVITAKAKEAFKQIKKPVLVEDVSLEIKSLNNLPGTFVKFFLETLGTEGTAALVKGQDTSTTVISAIAIYDGKVMKIFKGEVRGTLIFFDKGNKGFGFDKVFIPEGYKQSFAEMPTKLKNKISHRARALIKIKRFLIDNRK